MAPACKTFESEWRTLNVRKGTEQVQKVLELVKTYPGDPPEPNLHPDWQGTAKDKLNIIYSAASCSNMSRFEAFRFLLQSTLTPMDQKTVSNLLLDDIVKSAENQASSMSLLINRALIQLSIERHQLILSEAQGFEFNRIASDVTHLQNESRLNNYRTCDYPSRCTDDFAEMTLEKIEYFRAEKNRIHHEFSVWANVLLGDKQ